MTKLQNDNFVENTLNYRRVLININRLFTKIRILQRTTGDRLLRKLLIENV